MLPVKRLSWPQDKLQATSQHNPPWDRWASVEDARGWMLDSYTAMHKRLAEPLKGIFRSILEGEIPILFHCSAGKDRTGFCAAIILGVIGVRSAEHTSELQSLMRSSYAVFCLNNKN